MSPKNNQNHKLSDFKLEKSPIGEFMDKL